MSLASRNGSDARNEHFDGIGLAKGNMSQIRKDTLIWSAAREITDDTPHCAVSTESKDYNQLIRNHTSTT